jgi:hypothetical protein
MPAPMHDVFLERFIIRLLLSRANSVYSNGSISAVSKQIFVFSLNERGISVRRAPFVSGWLVVMNWRMRIFITRSGRESSAKRSGLRC